jgi:sugar/nucleoside kinase (ribokinase family)
MILVLGYANVDVVTRMPYLPAPGERVTATTIETFPGGMAANCACAASRLGGDVYCFSSIGNDPFGNLLRSDFKKYGVHTEHLSVANKTTKAIIQITPNGERSIVSEPCDYYPEKLETFLETSTHSGFLYVDGYHLGVASKEIELARAKGFTVYCDLDGATDTYETSKIFEYLELVHIVQVTPDIVRGLVGHDDTISLLKHVPTIIQTNGSEEVKSYTSRQSQSFLVPRANVIDTTGAGDIFAGAFLYFYEKSGRLEASIQQATKVAAKSVEVAGARLPKF